MSSVWELGLPIATWRNVLMVVDDGHAPVHAYAAEDSELAKLAKRHPRNVGLLVILPEGATPPSDEVRRAINVCMERHACSLRSVVCVVEGSGLPAAIVRATLTTMSLTLRKMRGWKVVSTVEEGLALVVSRTSRDYQLEKIDLEQGLRTLMKLRHLNSTTEGDVLPHR